MTPDYILEYILRDHRPRAVWLPSVPVPQLSFRPAEDVVLESELIPVATPLRIIPKRRGQKAVVVVTSRVLSEALSQKGELLPKIKIHSRVKKRGRAHGVCYCGCGLHVANPRRRFCSGHNWENGFLNKNERFS